MQLPEHLRKYLKELPQYDHTTGGIFFVPFKTGTDSFVFTVIASNGMGWEHVSVSIQDHKRCPRWEEMCFIKNLFWEDSETVVQYHPPKSEYINNHKYCLHLWKKVDYEYPLPPSIMVGIKT